MLRQSALLCTVYITALLAGCASSGEDTRPSIEDAARASCEQRQAPADQMQACIEEAEDTIRAARQRENVPPPPPPHRRQPVRHG